jgi:hypothetical protein
MIGVNSASSGVFVFFFRISRTNPSPNHFFVPFVSVCLFLGSHFFGVARVLQCSISPIRGRLRKSSLSCPCFQCLSSLTSYYFSCFTLIPMQAVRPNPAESPLPTRFGRSGRLYFSVYPSAHLHDSLCLTVVHTPPPCPMFPNASLLFLAIPHLTAPILG